MRWRVGIVLCLFLAIIGVGCRDPLTPNIDRNQAPETWITSAPFDTLTLRDANGKPINPEPPGIMPPGNKIPVRFHLHWTGSDRDGAVAGFYWAVVETLPLPPEGGFFVPNLPGPKPADYRFTTKTDSIFIFNVAEDVGERQHAFFIYAVDNLGKPDATPARFIFLAQDRYPPIPIFDECTCSGTVYDLNPGGSGVTPRIETKPLTESDIRDQLPRDTCASTSTLTFTWHAKLVIPQTTITGFRYKLDEPKFNVVGPEVRSVSYNTGVGGDTIPVSPGIKVFTLRAVDQSGGSSDATRRFQLNYAPDEWFSGPDPNPPNSIWTTKPNGEKYVAFLPGGALPSGGIPGSLLSPDSVLVLPASRRQRNTFFEVWKDTVYFRQEGDTVHMNSFVVFHAGGYDKDSPYRVRVNPIVRDPQYPGNFPGGPVLEPGPPNGSPIGFQSVVNFSLWPTNHPSTYALSGLFPIFDPNDPRDKPRIAGYHPVFQSGRAFAVMYAQDADGDRDKRVLDGRDLVQRVESGTATPEEQSLRSKVLTFYVNRAPYFQTDSPVFRPRVAAVDTFTSTFWDLRLVANDDDPWRPPDEPGGPSPSVLLTRRVQLVQDQGGPEPAVYDDQIEYVNQQNINLNLPGGYFVPGRMEVVATLCDCQACNEGDGRCVTIRIPVYYKPSAPGAPAP